MTDRILRNFVPERILALSKKECQFFKKMLELFYQFGTLILRLLKRKKE